MKLSIITPSHDPKFLKELKASILANDKFLALPDSWEWIVLLNGEAKWEPGTDERIKVYRSALNTTHIGALKKEAASYATGDYIIEVDHDDLLTVSALDRIICYAEDNDYPDFLYSRFANFHDKDKTPQVYGNYYGWKYEDMTSNGLDLKVAFNPADCPISRAIIYYMPNHVRVFKRSSYEQIGGHNAELEVCDDQDLMIRMYLAGMEFFEMPELLYIYRVHENTVEIKNDLIQAKQWELYYANIEAVAREWAHRNYLYALDMGGRFNKFEGYTSVDLKDADLNFDANKKWPIRDNSVGVIRADDFLEHIKDKQHFMKEAHRVLAHGGMLLTATPDARHAGFWQDPTHINGWVPNSFWYWTRSDAAKYIDNTTIRFQEHVLHSYFPSPWHEGVDIKYVVAHLSAIKNDDVRMPGPQLI